MGLTGLGTDEDLGNTQLGFEVGTFSVPWLVGSRVPGLHYCTFFSRQAV